MNGTILEFDPKYGDVLKCYIQKAKYNCNVVSIVNESFGATVGSGNLFLEEKNLVKFNLFDFSGCVLHKYK